MTPPMMSRAGLSAIAKSGCLARALSTTAAATTESSPNEAYSFVKSRAFYRKEVASLRKEFIAEEARRQEKLARDAEAQRQKIMKAKAARLEIKRQQQAIRAKEVAREKAIHDEKVRQLFAEKVEVRKERNAEVERRREAIVASLRQQSTNWITGENYEEKLKEDVFIYSPRQISARSSFDPSSMTGSAVSWLEKLQRMKPAGVQDSSDEAAASAVAAAADQEDATDAPSDSTPETPTSAEPTKKED